VLFCLLPTDPSYHDALGPMQILQLDDMKGWYQVNAQTTTRCLDGYHFEPPQRESHAPLYCSNVGMWMDWEAMTVRRCVQDKLNCSFPLVDLGFEDCQQPAPMIYSLLVLKKCSYVAV
jgi:hypothetical protein